MKKLFQKILSSGATGLLFGGTIVNVQPFQPLENTTNLAGSLSQWFTSNSLPQFFQTTFNLAFSAGAILAVLRLAYAGWLYMSTDAFGKKSQAKEVIRDAILGLLLLIGIYIILNQINPCLLNLNVLQTLESSSSTCTS